MLFAEFQQNIKKENHMHMRLKIGLLEVIVGLKFQL